MSKAHKLVVISGISGVGKTVIVNSLLQISERFVHFSAGSLIKKQLENVKHDELRLMERDRILHNQNLLLAQLELEVRNVSSDACVLFDAHMIIDNDQDLIEIPFDFFEKLNPSLLAFIQESPEIISLRRLQDSSRARPQRTIAELESQQDRSRKLAEEYCQRLSVPCLGFNSTQTEELTQKLLSFIVE